MHTIFSGLVTGDTNLMALVTGSEGVVRTTFPSSLQSISDLINRIISFGTFSKPLKSTSDDPSSDKKPKLIRSSSLRWNCANRIVLDFEEQCRWILIELPLKTDTLLGKIVADDRDNLDNNMQPSVIFPVQFCCLIILNTYLKSTKMINANKIPLAEQTSDKPQSLSQTVNSYIKDKNITILTFLPSIRMYINCEYEWSGSCQWFLSCDQFYANHFFITFESILTAINCTEEK